MMFNPPMVLPPEGTDPRKLVLTMQIICGALMMGLVTFGGIAITLGFNKQGPANQGELIVPLMGAGFAAIIIVVSLIVPPQVAKAGIRQITTIRPIDDISKLDLYMAYQTKMIVGCALLEGAGFFNLIGFIIGGQIWTLGIVGLLIAMMAVRFPTYERVDAWAEDQLRQLQANQL
jgi:hypothetical protein